MRIGRWFFRLVVALPLAIAIGYLPYHAYGPDGIGQARRLGRKLARVRAENQHLQKDNTQLMFDIGRLKNDRRAIERVARDELGLVRPDDLVFRFEEE